MNKEILENTIEYSSDNDLVINEDSIQCGQSSYNNIEFQLDEVEKKRIFLICQRLLFYHHRVRFKIRL